jgi:hypothetical protein
LSYLDNMPRRTEVILILLGPLSALILWVIYAMSAETVIRAVYDGRTPLALLNEVISGQSIHPVEYHLQKATDLVVGLAWLLSAAGVLTGLYVASVRRWPTSVIAQPVMGGILLSTASLCALYLLRLPLLKVFPGWFWPLHDKALPSLWLILPLAAGSWLIVRTVRNAPERRHRNLLLLILLGMGLQYGIVCLEGDGFQRLQERLTDTGHAVFVETAITQPSIWRVITDYDLLLEDLQSVYFHATKPPGLQVFLMVIERLARPLAGSAVDRVGVLGSLLFPFLACACLIPLLALLRRGRPKGDEDVSGMLYVFVPSIVLINLHADQYLYPLLGTSCLYFYVSALGQRHWLWALVAGAFFFVSLWFSFALLALLPAVPLLTYVAARSAGWRSSARTLGIASVGFTCAYLLFLWGLEYDTLTRWSQAIAAHAAAKGAQWGLAERAYYAGLNLVEFSLWCGPPLAVLCGSDLYRSLRQMADGNPDVEDGLVWSLAAILLALIVVGGTAGETARLWIFLLPLVTVSAARSLRHLAPGSLQWVIGLQLALTVVMKARQDFF